MSNIFAIGLSGMAAAQAQIGCAAHNIANAATAGFQRRTATTETRGSGGVTVTIGSAAVPGEDLAADLVAERQALYAFTANLRTVQTADELMGSLLDAFA